MTFKVLQVYDVISILNLSSLVCCMPHKIHWTPLWWYLTVPLPHFLSLQHLMNEWFSEKCAEVSKPLSIKTEPLAVDVSSLDSVEDCADFVKCVPSPHTDSMSHLRRSSVSERSSVKAAAAAAVQQTRDCSLGSAKKVRKAELIFFVHMDLMYAGRYCNC